MATRWATTGVRRAIVLPAAVPALLLALLLAAGPAAGQSFFAESEAVRPGSALRLTFSALTDDTRTESSAGVASSEVDSSAHGALARARLAWLGAGAMGEERRFAERTESFVQHDDRRRSAGWLALVGEGLLLDDDALLLVLSAARRSERFTFDQFGVGTFARDLDVDTERQIGLVARLAVVVLGYIQGRERARLQVDDPTRPFIDERYAYDFDAWIAGLVFGDPAASGLSLVWQRKETPAVAGSAVDRDDGLEELRRVLLGLGVLEAEFVETRLREAFGVEIARETTERDLSLGLRVSDALAVSLTQRRIEDRQAFTLLGIPAEDTRARRETLLSVRWRF